MMMTRESMLFTPIPSGIMLNLDVHPIDNPDEVVAAHCFCGAKSIASNPCQPHMVECHLLMHANPGHPIRHINTKHEYDFSFLAYKIKILAILLSFHLWCMLGGSA